MRVLRYDRPDRTLAPPTLEHIAAPTSSTRVPDRTAGPPTSGASAFSPGLMASTDRGPGGSTPLTFSIIIPTHARPGSLRACMEGIAALDLDRERFEVIVVNDGGPESLDGILAGLPTDLSVRLLTQPRGGPGSARNAGAALACGTWLAFIDDDCVPAPDWLSAFERMFHDGDRRLLGGRVENALVGNAYSDASERISHFVYERSRTNGAREPFFTTNNISLRADLFHSLGGFATTIPGDTAEDKEFCDRWRAADLALAHAPDALVRHAHHLTFRRFLRQHFNYGRGILAFRLMRRDRQHHKLVPEPSTFYLDLVTSPLRARRNGNRLRASLLIVAAQLATAAGAAHQAARWPLDRPSHPPRDQHPGRP